MREGQMFSAHKDNYTLGLERENRAVMSGEFSADALQGLGRMINSFTPVVERDPEGAAFSMKAHETTILRAIDAFESQGFARENNGIQISADDMRKIVQEYHCEVNRYSRYVWEIIARLLFETANGLNQG